jgi:uncharacterized protein YbjT (DUF2867 family)
MSYLARIGPRVHASKPGFAPAHVARLAQNAVKRVALDLQDVTVLTEAAIGAYGVTAPIAALAGAKHVFAVARDSQYGTAEQAGTWTRHLASLLGVEKGISVSGAPPEKNRKRRSSDEQRAPEAHRPGPNIKASSQSYYRSNIRSLGAA